MLSYLIRWRERWQMLINMDKRHVLHTGRHNQQFDYVWVGGVLEVAKAEKDVGVMIATDLKPSVQCARVAKKANLVLGQLARTVTYRDKVTFVRLYQVLVLPHLCYCAPAWSPYTRADIELLEKVQKRAVMMVTNIKGDLRGWPSLG